MQNTELVRDFEASIMTDTSVSFSSIKTGYEELAGSLKSGKYIEESFVRLNTDALLRRLNQAQEVVQVLIEKKNLGEDEVPLATWLLEMYKNLGQAIVALAQPANLGYYEPSQKKQ